jgi:hypothetical protein
MRSIGDVFSQIGDAFSVLWDHKKLLLFSFAGTLALVLFFYRLYLKSTQLGFVIPDSFDPSKFEPIHIAAAVAVALAANFMQNFVSFVLIRCFLEINERDECSLIGALFSGLLNSASILIWSALETVVGIFIRFFEDSDSWLGKIAGALMSVAWSAASYFALPIMAAKGVNPFRALDESSELVSSTWGTQAIGAIGFGLIYFFFYLLAIPFLFSDSPYAVYYFLGYSSFILSVQAAHLAVFRTDLYLYASHARNRFRAMDDESLNSSVRAS